MRARFPENQVLAFLRAVYHSLSVRAPSTGEEARALTRLRCVVVYFDSYPRCTQLQISDDCKVSLRSVARWIALACSGDDQQLKLLVGRSRFGYRKPGLSEDQQILVRELLKAEEEAPRQELRKPRCGKVFLSFLSENYGISLSHSQWRYWQRTLKPSPRRKGRWEL
jgi:hypothetical protein